MKITDRDLNKKEIVPKVPALHAQSKEASALPQILVVIVQDWEESERGWGVRPDGCSLHLTKDDLKQYINEYWEEEKKRNYVVAPDEYSRESGRPYAAELSDPEIIESLLKSRSLRFWQFEFPRKLKRIV